MRSEMRNVYIAVLVFGMLIVLSCGITKELYSEYPPDLRELYIKADSLNSLGHIAAVGIGKSSNLSMAQQKANLSVNALIAEEVSDTIEIIIDGNKISQRIDVKIVGAEILTYKYLKDNDTYDFRVLKYLSTEKIEE